MKVFVLSFLVFIFFSSVSCKKKKNNEVYSLPTSFQLSSNNLSGNLPLTDFHFINNHNGVLCGVEFLAKTVNGGAQWDELNVGSSQGFLTTFMLSDNEFFVARNGLFRTTDGGQNFTEICPHESIRDILFFDSSNGLIANGRIHKTTDGGLTWQQKYVSPNLFGISHMEFLTPSIGYANGGNSFDNSSFGEVIKTVDGGETWTPIWTSFTSQPVSISFVSAKTGYLVNYDNQIYKTIDGGITWNMTGITPNLVNFIYFVNNSEGYLSVPNGELYITHDSGANWELIHDFDEEYLIKMQQVGSSIYVLSTNGNIYKAS